MLRRIRNWIAPTFMPASSRQVGDQINKKTWALAKFWQLVWLKPFFFCLLPHDLKVVAIQNIIQREVSY